MSPLRQLDQAPNSALKRIFPFYRLAAIVSLLLCPPAFAAISYEQGNHGIAWSPSTSVTATFGSAQSAGNLNVVIIDWNDSTSTVTSVTDTRGNSYALAVGPTINAGYATLSIYYAKNIVSAGPQANAVTVSFNAAVSYPSVRIAEYSGLDTVNPFDVGVATSGSGTSMNSGSVTTTNANDLLVAGNYVEHTTYSPDPLFTLRIQTLAQDILEDRIVSSVGSYSAGAVQDQCCYWIMSMAAFKAASNDIEAPSAPSNLVATPQSSAQINLSWTAATDNVGVTGYRVERCLGASCSDFAEIAAPTGTSHNNSGLAASTTYRYRVRAVDAAGNLGPYTAIVNATTQSAGDTTPPSAPTSLGATPVSSGQINLSWTASTDNVAVTGYKVERCTGGSCTDYAEIASPTGTTYNNNGLTASTNYRYRVRATDAAGNLSAYSAVINATTLPDVDVTPPTTPTGFTATPASSTQINLSWTASTDNVGVTGYQVRWCEGAGCTPDTNLGAPVTGTTHTHTLLTGSTTYRYIVRALDAAGNFADSSIASATTPAPPDTTPPTTPTGFTATPASSTQINLSWTASTDNVGVTGYQVQWCQGASCTPTTDLGSPVTGTTLNHTTLTVSTTYRYRIYARDAAGNVSPNSSVISATTSALPDTTPPTTPTGLTATPASSTQINLSWTAATDNVSVTGYRIERCIGVGCSNFVEIATTTTADTYANTSGLVAGGSYSYRVRATDATGNLSPYTAIQTAVTTGTDATAPSVPTGLIATPVSGTQINLSWVASTDAQVVTGYQVWRCQGSATCTSFVQIATPITNTYNDTGRTPNTLYRYQVRAVDSSSLLSGYSTIVNATTTSGVVDCD